MCSLAVTSTAGSCNLRGRGGDWLHCPDIEGGCPFGPQPLPSSIRYSQATAGAPFVACLVWRKEERLMSTTWRALLLEVVYHGGEIGLLRDLYRATGSTSRRSRLAPIT